MPSNLNFNESETIRQFEVETINERNEPSGRFGWCFISRQQANHYCKDYKIPVHSIREKQIHIQMINQIENKHNSKNSGENTVANVAAIFKLLC